MRRNRITVPCTQCGKSLERAASWVNKQNKHFCNTACKAAWQSVHQHGKNNPHYNNGGKQVIRTCEHCGQTHNTYPSSSPRFCSQDCWNASRQPKTPTHTCLCCGKSFERIVKKQRKPKYCSIECRQKHVKPTRELLPLKTFVCEHCGAEFKDRRHIKRKYCCKACNTASHIGKKKDLADRVIETRYCKQCGKSFTEFPSQPRKFCCHKCYEQWQSENLSGEDSYNWQGGAVGDRGYNWNNQAALARERDLHTCQHCGITEDELEKTLDVHHIIPFRFFGLEKYEEANKLENLITLCRSCHVTVERSLR